MPGQVRAGASGFMPGNRDLEPLIARWRQAVDAPRHVDPQLKPRTCRGASPPGSLCVPQNHAKERQVGRLDPCVRHIER